MAVTTRRFLKMYYYLYKLGDDFYLLDKIEKPSKGQKFLILCDDESFGDVEINPIDDFRDYADSDFTDDCHTILASTKEIDLPLLNIEEINKILPTDKFSGDIVTPMDFVLFVKETLEQRHKDLSGDRNVSPLELPEYQEACRLAKKYISKDEWRAEIQMEFFDPEKGLSALGKYLPRIDDGYVKILNLK